MNLTTIQLNNPDNFNLILGQSHFIKTIEDIQEIMATRAPHIKYGIAFNEASQERLTRYAGNDETLVNLAIENMSKIACGHVFIIFFKRWFSN